MMPIVVTRFASASFLLRRSSGWAINEARNIYPPPQLLEGSFATYRRRCEFVGATCRFEISGSLVRGIYETRGLGGGCGESCRSADAVSTKWVLNRRLAGAKLNRTAAAGIPMPQQRQPSSGRAVEPRLAGQDRWAIR